MKQRFAWYNDSKFIINQLIKLHQISHFSLGLTSKLTAKPRENREQEWTSVDKHTQSKNSQASQEATRQGRSNPQPGRHIPVEILIHGSTLVSTFTKEIALSLTHYQSNRDADIDVSDHDTILLALKLAHQLDQTSFVENVQNLTHILRHYLDYLDKNRPFGRGRPRIRLYIRYFARELAHHLTYWSGKGLSSIEQSLDILEGIE